MNSNHRRNKKINFAAVVFFILLNLATFLVSKAVYADEELVGKSVSGSSKAVYCILEGPYNSDSELSSRRIELAKVGLSGIVVGHEEEKFIQLGKLYDADLALQVKELLSSKGEFFIVRYATEEGMDAVPKVDGTEASDTLAMPGSDAEEIMKRVDARKKRFDELKSKHDSIIDDGFDIEGFDAFEITLRDLENENRKLREELNDIATIRAKDELSQNWPIVVVTGFSSLEQFLIISDSTLKEQGVVDVYSDGNREYYLVCNTEGK